MLTDVAKLARLRAIELPSTAQIRKLDPGEAAVILLAEQLEAELVILDDKSARQTAMDVNSKL
jgi:predicted nucleic acid-binding protein